MDLHIGTINGYNNLIVIASPNLQLGQNSKVNDETVLQETPTEFDTHNEDKTKESTKGDFDEPQTERKVNIVEPQVKSDFDEPQSESKVNIVEPQGKSEDFVKPQEKFEPDKDSKTAKQETNNLTHDENKLLLTLGGVIAGPILIWMIK